MFGASGRTGTLLSAPRRSRKEDVLQRAVPQIFWESESPAKTDFGEAFAVVFFGDGEGVFLQGFLRKAVCRAWFFCGEGVVNCVVNVVLSHHVFGERKTCHGLGLFFQPARFGNPWADPCLYG
jgi:hypothetical protein